MRENVVMAETVDNSPGIQVDNTSGTKKPIPNLCQKYNKNHCQSTQKLYYKLKKHNLNPKSLTNEPYAQIKYKYIKAKVTWTLSKNAENKTE